VKVIIADDHPVVRQGLRQMLAVALPRFAAGVGLDELELMLEAATDGVQDAERFVRDFGPDAVAW